MYNETKTNIDKGSKKDQKNEYNFVADKNYLNNNGSKYSLIFHLLSDIVKVCIPDYVKVTFWRSTDISTDSTKLFDISILTDTKYSNKGKISFKFNNVYLSKSSDYIFMYQAKKSNQEF